MIIGAFTTKGLSLYFAKATMISVGEEIKKKLQFDMVNTLIKTDTQIIDKKHSGKYICSEVAHHFSSVTSHAYTRVSVIRSTKQQDDSSSNW